MTARTIAAAIVMAAVALHGSAQTRIASDFEIAQMKEQLAGSREFLAQLSAQLNLGDAYTTRSELTEARSRYQAAMEMASRKRVSTRRRSDLTGYSTATSYAALSLARLGRGGEAFALLEEAMRYSADSAKSWNLFASTMNALGKTGKAISASRNAVTIATREAASAPTAANRLDLAIYQHTLAAALIANGEVNEAERLLRALLAALQSEAFDGLRRQVARSESFEVYSTARGEVSAYVSLQNRARLRLAALLEGRGDQSGARAALQDVLTTRTDDAAALSAMARLSNPADRDRWFAAAFDANPFSLPLIRAFQKNLDAASAEVPGAGTAGARVRRALVQNARGEQRAARTTLDRLMEEFPGNETLALLRAETEAPLRVPRFLTASAPTARLPLEPKASELHDLLTAADRLAPEHRAALDSLVFVSTAIFDEAASSGAQTTLSSGTAETLPFRFGAPTVFNGVFAAGVPLRLTYRILGTTEADGRPALLLEPLGIEARP